MKFSVKTVLQRGGPRLGEFSQIQGKPDVVLETPLALLHTQAGHIPHITHEVLRLVSKEPHILQIPMVSIHSYREALRLYENRLSEFVGSKDSLTYVTLHDPSNLTKQGHHVKDKVPVFTKNGKVLYDCDKYMNMINDIKPDMYVLLSDGDTNVASPAKRIVKAVDNTISFHKQCIESHKKSDMLKDSFVIAPIAGGYCSQARQKCIELMKPNELYYQGFLIDGLHNNGPEVEFIPFNEVQPVIETVVRLISPEKLRVVQGCWSPINILKMVQNGIDLFDTSYCRILTERSAALTFAIEPHEHSDSYELNLRQEEFVDEFHPLLRDCQCITCQGYSRAYIHHLLTVQELLGSKIRDSIRDGNLNQLEDRVAEQVRLFQVKEERDIRLENSNNIV